MADLITEVPQRVLAVYAHPDDADVACGGTLALWAGGALVHEVCYRAGRRFGSSDGAADGKGYLVSSAVVVR